MFEIYINHSEHVIFKGFRSYRESLWFRHGVSLNETRSTDILQMANICDRFMSEVSFF